MFSSIFNKNRLYNSRLSKYCTKSTNESILKMVQKYKEEQKDKKIDIGLLITNSSKDPEPNNNSFFIHFFLFSLYINFYILFIKQKTVNMFSFYTYIDGINKQ